MKMETIIVNGVLCVRSQLDELNYAEIREDHPEMLTICHNDGRVITDMAEARYSIPYRALYDRMVEHLKRAK